MTYTVFTGHGHCILAVFICNSYLTVGAIHRIWTGKRYAILTVFADFHGFSLKIFVHLHIDSRVTCCCILFDESLNIVTTIVGISSFAFTFNSDSRA